MYSEDRELFGKAVLEVLVSKYDDELKWCKEDAGCSEIHLRKMRGILGYNVCKPKVIGKRLRKFRVAIIIAAALLLVGCAAYVYREKIKGFIFEHYDKYVEVQFDVDLNAVPTCIEAEYALGYVPEGFEQVRRTVLETINFQEWNNESGDSILFVQEIIGKGGYDVDNERGEMSIFEYGEYTILLKTVETVKLYLWNDGKYGLVLEVPIYTADEEVLKIIDNITS